MNWAIPRAPAAETANGLKFGSAISWAASDPAETFQRSAERSMGIRKRAGTKPGSPAVGSRSPAPAGGGPTPLSAAEHGAGPRV